MGGVFHFDTWGTMNDGAEGESSVLVRVTYADEGEAEGPLFNIHLGGGKGDDRWEADVDLDRDALIRLHAFLTMILALPLAELKE